VFDVCEVSEVRSLSLAERPCSGSSLASCKIPIIDDDVICDIDAVDDTTTPCELKPTDDFIRSKASFPDMVEDEVEADNDDDAPRDSVFPAKPPEHTSAASCPSSPPSDVVRTSAEGRTGDGEEQTESDDNMTTTSTS